MTGGAERCSPKPCCADPHLNSPSCSKNLSGVSHSTRVSLQRWHQPPTALTELLPLPEEGRVCKTPSTMSAAKPETELAA